MQKSDNQFSDFNFYSLEEKIAFHNLIPVLQSQLNHQFGKLEKYIKTLTKAERAYGTAFVSGNSHQDKKRAIWLVLQDLDYIVGKLEGMTEEEFEILMKPKVSSSGEDVLKMIFANQHPHKRYWKMIWTMVWGWVKNPLSQVIIGVIVIAIGAWLGLNR